MLFLRATFVIAFAALKVAYYVQLLRLICPRLGSRAEPSTFKYCRPAPLKVEFSFDIPTNSFTSSSTINPCHLASDVSRARFCPSQAGAILFLHAFVLLVLQASQSTF